MRAAIEFNCFGNDRNRPFLSADCMSAITCYPTPQKLLVKKNRVVVEPNGEIHIGATMWDEAQIAPEQEGNLPPDVFEAVKSRVVPVKGGNFAFRHVVLDGKLVEVKPQGDKFVDRAGNRYETIDVRFKYFNSNILEEYRGEENLAEYVDWCNDLMDNGRLNGLVIDEAQPAGQDMIRVIEGLYFSPVATSNRVVLPEFFYRTKENLVIDESAADEVILRAANNPGVSIIETEKSGMSNGVVTDVARDENGMLVVTVTKTSCRYDQGKLVTVMTSERSKHIYPDTQGVVEVLVSPITKYTTGSIVDPDDLCGELLRLVRIIPAGRYQNLGQVESVIGKTMLNYLREAVVSQSRLIIEGEPAIAMSFLKELPENFNPKRVVVKNQQHVQVLDVDDLQYALVGQNKFVKYDLIHHPWFQKREMARNIPRNWFTTPFRRNTPVAV